MIAHFEAAELAYSLRCHVRAQMKRSSVPDFIFAGVTCPGSGTRWGRDTR